MLKHLWAERIKTVCYEVSVDVRRCGRVPWPGVRLLWTQLCAGQQKNQAQPVLREQMKKEAECEECNRKLWLGTVLLY